MSFILLEKKILPSIHINIFVYLLSVPIIIRLICHEQTLHYKYLSEYFAKACRGNPCNQHHMNEA